jgi:hypothetical protein
MKIHQPGRLTTPVEESEGHEDHPRIGIDLFYRIFAYFLGPVIDFLFLAKFDPVS